MKLALMIIPVVSFFVIACNSNPVMRMSASIDHSIDTAIAAPDTTIKKNVFYCGALTKAGKPCKHRVKQQGAKCFQHQK